MYLHNIHRHPHCVWTEREGSSRHLMGNANDRYPCCCDVAAAPLGLYSLLSPPFPAPHALAVLCNSIHASVGHPVGTIDSSPAIYRWVAAFQSSQRDSVGLSPSLPTSELVGYFRTSLRDDACVEQRELTPGAVNCRLPRLTSPASPKRWRSLANRALRDVLRRSSCVPSCGWSRPTLPCRAG